MKKKIIIIVTILIIIFLMFLSILIIKNDKKKILLPNNITSIAIEYYPNYNISTAEVLNSIHDYNFIEKQTIYLNEEEINDVKKEFNNVYDDSKEYAKCDCLAGDNYKIIINNKHELILDKHWGQYKYLGENIIVHIPDQLYNYILNKVDANDKNIFKTIDANKMSIENDNKQSIVNDKLKDDFLNKLSYLEVNNQEDYLTYDGGYTYVLHFDDNKVLYLYRASVIGYLVDNNSNFNSYVLVRGINDDDIKYILESLEENNETTIKYLEYIEENSNATSGVKYIINVDEEVLAKKYKYSQESLAYEEIDSQIWDKQKWKKLEKELYDMNLKNWKTKQVELNNRFNNAGGFPADGDTYKMLINFNDDSKMELNAYYASVFDIEIILNKYFNNSTD